MAETEIAPPRRRAQARAGEMGARRELRPRRAPDAQTLEKSRGRLELRELWVVPAEDLEPYLAAEWGWESVRQIGWVRRWRKRRASEQWSVEEITIISSHVPEHIRPHELLALIRGHWTIENRVHWPRDLSFHEDRWHGRAIGQMLAEMRNLVLNLIRRVWPQVFIPDAWRRLSRDPGMALRWLHFPLMN